MRTLPPRTNKQQANNNKQTTPLSSASTGLFLCREFFGLGFSRISAPPGAPRNRPLLELEIRRFRPVLLVLVPTTRFETRRDETKHPSGGPDATAVSSGTNRIESNPEHTPKQSGINSRGRITKPTASTCSTGSRRVELSEPQRDPRARHARIVVVDRWCLLLPTFQWEPIPVFGTRRETRRRRARSKHCRLCHGR